MSSHAVPIGGELWNRQYKALAALAGFGLLLMFWRFAQGLGATTGLNDGHPWGIWIAFDVVTGTALGCGGYVIVILVYLLNQGCYHPLVRAGILTRLANREKLLLLLTDNLRARRRFRLESYVRRTSRPIGPIMVP
jgi:Ni/Fe-hydrogenase subunit HybB-like protein